MHRNVCTKTAFSLFPSLLVLFYLSFIGELEKTGGKIFLSPKLLQAGCLEETDFVVEKYGPGITQSSPSFTKYHLSFLLDQKSWAEE